jgi:pimeloyl-ACP methyl ester carboxylesterase/SAM-dependent methyltransferase
VKRVAVNGVSIAYEERGSGEETVVLSHSYLVDHRHYEHQIEALAERYRVLAYDHRGHGESERPRDGDYDMETLYRDAERFIEVTEAAPCHFVGLSTGGFVGLRLGFRRPDLLRSLVLMDTSADAEPWVKRIKYEAMFAVLRRAGFEPLMPATMAIMFGPTFLGDASRRDEAHRWRQRIMDNDIDALIRFGRGIFARESVADHLGDIEVPTLVMVGEHDVAQPLSRAQRIVDGIEGALLQVVPRAGHLSTIENPDAVSGALLSFFETGRLPTRDGEPANVRSPRSVLYDGAIYGRVVEPLLAGVHGFIVGNLPEGERVIDACCGTGGLAGRMAEAGRHVTGVDLSPQNIAFARRRFANDSVTFDVGDVAQLPHEDDAFDVATVVMALHEMPHACRVPVLRELGRVAQRVMVVDFRIPMPANLAGLRNRAVELAAGKDHFSAFLDYGARGGLGPLVEASGLMIESARTLDQGTLDVHVLRR